MFRILIDCFTNASFSTENDQDQNNPNDIFLLTEACGICTGSSDTYKATVDLVSSGILMAVAFLLLVHVIAGKNKCRSETVYQYLCMC